MSISNLIVQYIESLPMIRTVGVSPVNQFLFCAEVHKAIIANNKVPNTYVLYYTLSIVIAVPWSLGHYSGQNRMNIWSALV